MTTGRRRFFRTMPVVLTWLLLWCDGGFAFSTTGPLVTRRLGAISHHHHHHNHNHKRASFFVTTTNLFSTSSYSSFRTNSTSESSLLSSPPAELDSNDNPSVSYPQDQVPDDYHPATSKAVVWEAPFKGIIRDYRQRLPHYASDITDAFNGQSIAATAVLFFACLAPAIGFGQLLSKVTQGQLGTMELLLSTSLGGMGYALFSAQPMTLLGGTGPLLAFVTCLVSLAQTWQVPFLPLYAWTGFWTSGFLGLASLTSASHLVQYLTRFTDDIFSVFISALFILEAVQDITSSFGGSTIPALLTLICATTTFQVITSLKRLPQTKLFNRTIRNQLSQFGPTLGVLASVGVSQFMKQWRGLILPSLSLPVSSSSAAGGAAGLISTTTGRSWWVPLTCLPVWARWAASIPALMATVLIFLDHNITVRLVNQRDMSKGNRTSVLQGMHADLFVVSLWTGLASLFGLPWLEAATVRSVTHCQALTYTTTNGGGSSHANGSSRGTENGRVTNTREQRVTGWMIHALLGACVWFPLPRQWLTWIPQAGLTGLFLYLGVSALRDNELWDRCVELVQEDKTKKEETQHFPQRRWSSLPTRVVQSYTLLQVACIAVMIGVKSNPVLGVVFPLVTALLTPLRRIGMKRWFRRDHLDLLDATEA